MPDEKDNQSKDQKSKDQAVETAPDEKKKVEVDPVEELRKELQTLRQKTDGYEPELKKLSGMLTKAQQENAELTRFVKNVKIPEVNKTFEQKWAENPEDAVRSVAQDAAPQGTSPYERAMFWINNVAMESPALAPLRNRVIEIGREDASHFYMTHSEQGIRDLYLVAQRETEAKELEGFRAMKKTEEEKSRAFSEGSNVRPGTKKGPAPMTSEERRVARMLGVKEEEYAKMKDRRDLEETHRGHQDVDRD